MPKGRRFWNAERDARLRKVWAEPGTIEDIAAKFGNVISSNSVKSRARKLGLTDRLNRNHFWNADRDELLRALWAERPLLTGKEMQARLAEAEIGGAVSLPSISTRGAFLKLPAREAMQRAQKRVPFTDASTRSPFPGEDVVSGASAPAPRIRTFTRFEPCPFYHPMEGGACGVLVDRTLRAGGTRGSQYCAAHAHRILPIARGNSPRASSRH